jgi:hypothetical protein
MSSAPDSATDIVALVRRAQQNAVRAAGEWKPTDAGRIAECVSALDSVASDLRTAKDTFQPDAPSQPRADNPDYSAMRADLLSLKQSLARLNRLIEASAAFVRNLPGQNARAGESYGAGGHLCSVAAPPVSSIEA